MLSARLASLLLILLVAGCSIDANYGDAGFLCNAEEPCQPGFECQAGQCVRGTSIDARQQIDANPNPPDADPTLPDADPSLPDADPSLPDASLPDAAIPDAAIPDASPPDAIVIDAAPPADADPACVTFQPILGGAIDNFSDGIATPLWGPFNDGGTAVAETGGELVVSPAVNQNNGRFAGYDTLLQTNLTGFRVYIEITQMVTTTSAARVKFRHGKNINDEVFFEQQAGTLTFGRTESGTTTDTSSVTFNAIDHRWWQLRESGGTVFGEVSPDAINWTVLGSAAAIPAITTSGRVRLQAGTDDAVTNPGQAKFDNYNGGGIVCL